MSLSTLYINQLKLSFYKNYVSGAFEFCNRLNLVVGNNGKGKTNLLDAIYYSCLTKSYHSSSDLMVLNFSGDFFRIETDFVLNSENQLLELKYIKHDKKELKVNKVKVERQADFIGKYPCVIITPDDNQLLLGGSEIRRKFMDFSIAQFSPQYLSNLLIYNKILAQRNALLKSFFENRTYDQPLLETYNAKLIAAGNVIVDYRKRFLEKFLPVFSNVYKQIFEGQETVSVTYESDLLDAEFEELINSLIQQDRLAQRTTKGIHTDDLRFELNGFPVKKIGSQGQQKTFLLSLKLAQYILLKEEKQCFPILLLDDIFDKLDYNRISKLFSMLNSEIFGQVFLSDTDDKKLQQLLTDNQIENYKFIHLD